MNQPIFLGRETNLIPGEYKIISVTEYEALQRDSNKLRAIRNRLDEYHMRKKLSNDAYFLHRLRRRTIGEIVSIMHRKDV